MTLPEPLTPDRLYTACDPKRLGFRTTDEVQDSEDNLGQARAAEALRFGIDIEHGGYNIFALGPHGTGKQTTVQRALSAAAAKRSAPDDWCYVHNFDEPYRPIAMRLPAGRGCGLREDMENLVDELKVAIPAAFDSEDYRSRREALDEDFKQRQEQAFNALQERAVEKGAGLVRTPMGFAVAPVENGEVVTPDVFRGWPQERQDQMKANIAELEKELQELLRDAPRWEREHRDKVRELNHEVTERAVGHLISELKGRYEELPQVIAYLDKVEHDVVANAQDFVQQQQSAEQQVMVPPAVLRRALQGPPSFRRYQVNVIVDNGAAEQAPVVYEDLPTYPNLIGRIEQMAQFGALTTDFNLIKGGAMHRANGGYLVLDARKVLLQPFVWEELKRALQARQIKIQGVYESLGLAATVTLEPEPIPLDVKIVLLGEPQLYYLLSAYDPDFLELFKVQADFDDRVRRDDATIAQYARLVAGMARRIKLRPFEAGAVARIIERAARLADDSERLTLRMRAIVDLLSESDYWARLDGRPTVAAEHVDRAVTAQIHRADRIRQRSQEEIVRGTILIETSGAAVGQVNALAVLQLGDISFGRPNRITARVRMGRGEVLDIEREAALGGPLHTKGVMILAGFLGERFARDRPLALQASLVFEQSYGGVDGDSASSTEVYALLSALSGVPIKQCFAVTGSVNQHGEVQAIGGANEKIEGFFDVCNARGLTGEQAVLIPASNVKHLMLRSDVVAAVAEGKFHIYPVETIDQGIEILTGVAAGERDAEGNYPPDSVNGKAQAAVEALAEKARAFAQQGREQRS